jgi:hypothetical protein
MMVALIDGRDTGVIWELGYAYGIHLPIVTVSAEGYGNNIMIEQSVIGHIPDVLADGISLLSAMMTIKSNTDEALK